MGESDLFGPTMTISQAKNYIKILAADKKKRAMFSLCMWGPPGVGKSDASRQAANEIGIDYKRQGVSTVDYIKVAGYPELQGKGSNRRAVSHSFLNVPADGEGIWVFDDWTHAPAPVQNLMMDAALFREINEKKIGDGWLLVLCANQVGVGVHSMGQAVSGRFLHVHVVPDLECFKSYALKNDLRPEIIGFLEASPDYLYVSPDNEERAYPTPRSWEKLSHLLDANYSLKDGTRLGLHQADPELLQHFIGSAVGPATAPSVASFVSAYGLVDVEEAASGSLDNLYSLSGADSAELLVLGVSLVAGARVWWNRQSKRDYVSIAKGLGNILRYLPQNLQVRLLTDIQRTDDSGYRKMWDRVRKDSKLSEYKDELLRLGETMISDYVDF